MASASSTSARSLFVESKMRLADRVQVNVNNIASLARQIQRGSKSSEVKFQCTYIYLYFTRVFHVILVYFAILILLIFIDINA